MEKKLTKNVDSKVLKLVQLSVLVAIMVIFDVTNIGYIKTPVIELTIMMVPVIIGGITLGKTAGTILGGVFGLTSFLQCFGRSTFGVLLFGYNPFFAFIVCMIPRMAAGFLVAFAFQQIKKIDKTKSHLPSFGIAGFVGAMANTVIFTVMLFLFFQNEPTIASMEGAYGIFSFAVALVGFNGLIEAVICTITGAVIAKAISKLVRNN